MEIASTTHLQALLGCSVLVASLRLPRLLTFGTISPGRAPKAPVRTNVDPHRIVLPKEISARLAGFEGVYPIRAGRPGFAHIDMSEWISLDREPGDGVLPEYSPGRLRLRRAAGIMTDIAGKTFIAADVPCGGAVATTVVFDSVSAISEPERQAILRSCTEEADRIAANAAERYLPDEPAYGKDAGYEFVRDLSRMLAQAACPVEIAYGCLDGPDFVPHWHPSDAWRGFVTEAVRLRNPHDGKTFVQPIGGLAPAAIFRIIADHMADLSAG